MREFIEGNPLVERGVWMIDGVSATMSCPLCGKHGCLDDHNIDDEGNVTPSLVCPSDDCVFHEYGKLVGWEIPKKKIKMKKSSERKKEN